MSDEILNPAIEAADLEAETEQTPEMSPEELGLHVKTCIQDHENESSKWLDEFTDFDKLYRSMPTDIPDVPADSVYARTSIMEMFTDTETFLGNLLALFYSDSQWFETNAPGMDMDPQKTMDSIGWQELLGHGLREMKFRSRSDPYLRDLIINGTGVGATEWDFKVTYVDSMPGNIKAKYERVPTMDGPVFRNVPLHMFHRAPGAEDIEPADWIIEESEVNPNEVRQIIAAVRGLPGAVVDEDALEAAIREGKKEDNQREKAIATARGYNDADTKSRLIHVSSYYGYHPGKEDSPITWRILAVNKAKAVAWYPNPYKEGYKPYLKANLIPLSGSFYGMGFGHILKRPQVEINHGRALMRNGILRWAFNMFNQIGGKYRPNEKIYFEPGKVLHSSQYGTLTPLGGDLVGLQAQMQLEGVTKDDMRRAVVANDITQAATADVTAQENRSLISGTAKRLRPIAETIIENFHRPFLERMIRQYEQFMSGEVLIRVVKEHGRSMAVLIRKAALPADAGVVVNLAFDADFGLQMSRRLTAAVQMITTLLEKRPDFNINVMPFIAKIAKMFRIDPNEVVVPREAAPDPSILAMLAAKKADAAQMPPQIPRSPEVGVQ